MQNACSRADVTLCDDGPLGTGSTDCLHREAQRRTGLRNGRHSRLKSGVRKHMSTPQIAHQHLPHIQRYDSFRQPRMASVHICALLLTDRCAGFLITALTGHPSLLRSTDCLQKGGDCSDQDTSSRMSASNTVIRIRVIS